MENELVVLEEFLTKEIVNEILQKILLGKTGITEEIDAQLSKETSPSDIKEKGNHPYVAGKKYISDIKTIDPNFEWNIIEFPKIIGNVETGIGICYCTGRLTIKGISRDGVGSYLIPCYDKESLSWKCKKKDEKVTGIDPRIGQPILEHAPKSAETSAFKRAAEKFGVHLDITGEAPEEVQANEFEILNTLILIRQLQNESKETEQSFKDTLKMGKFTRALYFKWRSYFLSKIKEENTFSIEGEI